MLLQWFVYKNVFKISKVIQLVSFDNLIFFIISSFNVYVL